MSLNLYLNTIQIVLKVDLAAVQSWSHIYGALCCLHQSLLCPVCLKLLVIPQRPISSDCQHNYCKKCIVGIKTQCKECFRAPKFEENVLLRVILQCYKNMCIYILTSPIFHSWKKGNLTDSMQRFKSMVSEGASLRDEYHTSHFSYDTLRKNLQRASMSNSKNMNTFPINDKDSFTALWNSFIYKDSKKYEIKKRRILNTSLEEYYISDLSSDDSEIDCPKVIAECLKSIKKRRKSCRCGLASQTPGMLTCCGQRCPCYVSDRACINCRCKGCRNPKKSVISSPPCPRNYHLKKSSEKYFLKREDKKHQFKDVYSCSSLSNYDCSEKCSSE